MDGSRGGGQGETPQTGLRRAVRMMISFFGEDERFAVTNQSMAAILRTLQSQMDDVAHSKDEQLLDYWDRELDAFRKRMLELAASHTVALPSGTKVPLVTESVATPLLLPCPHPPELPEDK